MTVGQQLKPTRIRATPERVATAFVTAAKQAGLEPTDGLIGVLMAQSALETGNWSVMYNFNFGNVKATDPWIAAGGHYTFYDFTGPHAKAPVSENLTLAQVAHAQRSSKMRTDGSGLPDMEVVKQLRSKPTEEHPEGKLLNLYYCRFWPSHIQTRFRAFESLPEGAFQYLKKLTGRYAPGLEPAARGDVRGYVTAIRRLGYFTAPLEGYIRVVQDRYNRYISTARAAMTEETETSEEPLSDTGALVSELADCEVHDSGFTELKSGAKITNLPIWDGEHSLFARLGHGAADKWLRSKGMRLATAAEMQELHNASTYIAPYTLPTRAMLKADGVPQPWQDAQGRDTPQMARYRAAHMRSPKWCHQHDAEVFARLKAAGWQGGPVSNAGKHWIAPVGTIDGWWYASGAKIQNPSRFHASDPTYTDYATNFHGVLEEGAELPEEDDVPDSAPTEPEPWTDSSLSVGERAVLFARAEMAKGIEEIPPRSNKSPRISEYLEPCVRDGKGQIGKHLAKTGANWCAAFFCFCIWAVLLAGDPQPTTKYRCSGFEMEQDAKKKKAWFPKQLVLEGKFDPVEGDIVIYKSGTAAWRRHVCCFIRWIDRAKGIFETIGGNEGNTIRINSEARLDHPALRGFIAQPRVERDDEVAEATWERAEELDRQFWAGHDGLDDVEAMYAAIDDQEDGEVKGEGLYA